MDISLLSLGTQEVLHDLQAERGLRDWQVVPGVRFSTHSDHNEDDEMDVIYGYALTTSLQEERIDRKRKRETGKASNDNEQPTWSCFLVLPAVSYAQASPTLSIKRLLELQECADANEPDGGGTATKQTFLCLTDAANIRYRTTIVYSMLQSL